MAFLIAGIVSIAFWWALAGVIWMGWASPMVLVLPIVVAAVLIGLAVRLEEHNGQAG